MQNRKIMVEIIVMKTKAVVKNQCLIKYLIPKSEVLTLRTALVNTTEVLLKVISKELAAYSALLKFSMIKTVKI